MPVLQCKTLAAHHFESGALRLEGLVGVATGHGCHGIGASTHAHLLAVHLRLIDGVLAEEQHEHAAQPEQQQDVV